ncbi:MAG: glycosyltransferase [Lachnospiraceae bacterium]|nr:glycosyltransferase [Lachnospiraceae bacterium]
MKHIVFFTLSMKRGGAEGVIARLTEEYLRHHYKVTIVTCMNCPAEYPLDPTVELVYLDEEGAVYQNMGERFLKRRKRLSVVLDKLAPDLLISFLPEPNFLAMSMKGKCSFPMIISVRNDPAREYRNKIYYLLMRLFYPKADGYVFQTADAGRYFSFSKHIASAMTIIPNPLGRDYLNLQKSENREPKIVHVGRMDRQKNQVLLLKACKPVLEAHPEYKLEMYGDGALRGELENLVAELGLKERVAFGGIVKDLKERMEDASCFVLSSDYEGMPNALMEAMALGVPVVSTDCPCGGPAYLIEDGVCGRLVPVGAQEALSRALDELVADRGAAEEMAEHAIDRMREFYPENIYQKWHEYIRRFLADSGGI